MDLIDAAATRGKVCILVYVLPVTLGITFLVLVCRLSLSFLILLCFAAIPRQARHRLPWNSCVIVVFVHLGFVHLPYFFGYKTQFFFLPNNPKNLDPSYKMDLDLWDCLGRVKLIL